MAENNNAIDQGLFGYQNIMKEFYNYKPDKDDSEGRAIKNSFMAVSYTHLTLPTIYSV